MNNEIKIIGTIDPSGTTETGLFFFISWNNYKISHIRDEDWQNQLERISQWIKANNIREIICETGRLFNDRVRYKSQMTKLIKLVGSIEVYVRSQNLKFVEIDNTATARADRDARLGLVKGLKLIDVKGRAGRPKKVWHFKGQAISEHEKDAILVFQLYWTKRLKKEWPWTD